MRITCMFSASLMVLALAATASAQSEGLYFAPKIGLSHMKADINGDLSIPGRGKIPLNGDGKGNQPVLGFAVGYDFNLIYDGTPLRAELEYAWRGKKELYSDNSALTVWTTPIPMVKKGEFEVHSLFINAYFDNGLDDSTTVAPYIGAGLGLALVSADYSTYTINGTGTGAHLIEVAMSKKKTNLAWNVGGGVAWEIAASMALDLGYRYADFGNVEASTTVNVPGYSAPVAVDSKVTSHEVLMGLRYTF